MKIAFIAALLVVLALCGVTFFLAVQTCEAYGCAPTTSVRAPCGQARPGSTRRCAMRTPQPVCVRLSAAGGCERWQNQ